MSATEMVQSARADRCRVTAGIDAPTDRAWERPTFHPGPTSLRSGECRPSVGSMTQSGYTPIAEHGLIGDLRTAALVGTDGRVDWFCPGRFDAPSVFGAILDTGRGGHWTIAPTEPWTSRQFYLPDSNVLVTRFSVRSGVIEVQDCMPVLHAHDPDHRQRLVRRVVAVRGTVDMGVELSPRFDYGRAKHRAEQAGPAIVFCGPTVSLALTTSVPLSLDEAGDAAGGVRLARGEVATFVLDVLEGPQRPPHVSADAEELVAATIAFWRRWLANSRYTGRWREMVHRSALTLKLLTHEPSGAIVAAPTMALPEELGGGRNWDYRHVWVRDAAFSLYALLRLGFTDEAEAFMHWLAARAVGGGGDADGPLRVVYDIDGCSTAGEEVLEHWEGHRGSSPVRVHNDAADQLQLDIYGELIDSVYLFDKHGPGISYDLWRSLQGIVAWLQANWRRPDEGIWEVRSGRRDHTFSRLMCWVALERMVRMARQRGLPGDVADWSRTRDEIFTAVLEEGWDDDLQAFVQSSGSGVLDASLLLMPMVKFLAPTDPRVTSTLAALERTLVTDSLVFRYDPTASPDGLDGEEGTFSICSFWYVEALTRAGRVEDARLALEKMFTYANPLGLYAEQVGLTGEQLGNFPQAFTHLSLISAAINLDRVLG